MINQLLVKVFWLFTAANKKALVDGHASFRHINLVFNNVPIKKSAKPNDF